jgi:hypothetical protein
LNPRPLGYEQADRCRSVALLLPAVPCGLGRGCPAVLLRLIVPRLFGPVLVTMPVTTKVPSQGYLVVPVDLSFW